MDRAEHVALINEEMQRRYFPEGDVEGQRIRVPALLAIAGQASIVTAPEIDEWVEIIGVVATARNRGLRESAEPAIYIPYSLALPPGLPYLVRTEGDSSHLINTLRRQVASVDPDQPATSVQTLEEVLERSGRAYPRFSTMLFSIFAVVGLLLAATGLYSVVSYTVARRTHEFGIRMAVGARGLDILRLATSTTARLMFAGIVIGLGGSLALSRVIANHLQGWDPTDPVAFPAVTVVLLAVALAACWIPARRATSIDPVNALRHE
jgi:putative ABC transport system permease protein